MGNENTVKVNTEGEDRLETTKVDEKEAYEQIKEELGIQPVQLQYMPLGMKFDKCVIEKSWGLQSCFIYIRTRYLSMKSVTSTVM